MGTLNFVDSWAMTLEKKIPALQIYHNPLGTLLYIAIKKAAVYATFCRERQYIGIYLDIVGFWLYP